ncbi:MAG: [protein-PII] uridylyltransferase, partial [Gammaproteobacteria bacterium]|nr:[protein-PII] uridylyltransferase [Gammaproteobacteria bacterium]
MRSLPCAGMNNLMALSDVTLSNSLLDFIAERLQQRTPSLQAYRETLQKGSQRLGERFLRGESIEQLVGARSRLIDEVLTAAWQQHIDSDTPACLAAVGGYGRGELHPHSDIDLLILLEQEDEASAEALSRLLTFFWDIGLEVGHSVRSLDQCVEEALGDVTVITNLMESRYLTGQRDLFEQMRRRIEPERIWSSEAFFAAKLEEQQQRHRKFGGSSYNLEPNIKEGPGGLRDIQVIGWVAKRHYGAETMFDLVRQGFLSEEEYGTLMDGQRLLWRIRFALHLLTGRREDRLLFDYQRTLAAQFGYVDADNNLAVEQFMQRYYRTIMELNRLNDMLLQLFQEAIVLHGQACIPQPINRRFQSCNGYLEVIDERVFKREPYALLELFLLLSQNPQLQGVRANTIRLIRNHRHLIDDSFRNDLRNRALFMELLRQPSGCVTELRRMNRYGILAAYLPAFANIVGRMQYDLYHVYTVDEHSLFVMRNISRLMGQTSNSPFRVGKEIPQRIAKPELLYLAALFHDIAKGRGGDHSELGEQEARAFCRLHLLSEHDAELVAWLVRQHLLMSITAQRKDISDPDVIGEFAAIVGNHNRLNHLFLLTLADGQATNPARWSAWKESLLSELHHAASQALQRGLDNPRDQEDLILEKCAQALALLQQSGLERAPVEALWNEFGNHFFLHNQPDEIARQTAAVLAADLHALPLIQIRDDAERGATEVLIYTHDRKQLFALTTGLLDRLGLNILDARIQTTRDGYTLNNYKILEEDASPVSEPRRKQEIADNLRQVLLSTETVDLKMSRRMARRLKHFDTGTEIRCLNEAGLRHSLLQVTTGDRPGLLARIGLGLSDCGIRLHGARISTIGEVAEDIFYVTGPDGMTL